MRSLASGALLRQPARWFQRQSGLEGSAAVPAPAAGFASPLASAGMLVAAGTGSSAGLQKASRHAAQNIAEIRQLQSPLGV